MRFGAVHLKTVLVKNIAYLAAVTACLAFGPTNVGQSQPVQTEACCKICKKGKACGDSCINRDYNCTKPPGCACNA